MDTRRIRDRDSGGASGWLNRGTAGCVLTLIVLVLCVTINAHAAPSKAAAGGVGAHGQEISNDAPAIILPTMPDAKNAQPSDASGTASGAHYAPVILRGAIGHVPNGHGSCVRIDGTTHTKATYVHGLPHTVVRSIDGVQQKRATIDWNAHKVLVQRVKTVTEPNGRPATPAQQRASAPGHSTQHWQIRNLSWDRWTRPKSVTITRSDGTYQRMQCTWQNRIKGTCSWRDNRKAVVHLTPRGEVSSVRWINENTGISNGRLNASWDRHLLVEVSHEHGVQNTTTRYGYNKQGVLRQMAQKTRTLDGPQILQWRFTRGPRENVVRVERRCSGACSGVRPTKIIEIRYDQRLDHTFCGTWWDDGIVPSLRGLSF